MIKKIASLGLSCALMAAPMFANEGAVPKGIPKLDHVFVVMMENHGFSQIIGNPNAPFTNQYAKTANLATNYFAIAHPSLTNYLEVVGGSNFGVQTDNSPDWHNKSCATNLSTGVAATDNPPSPSVCPIYGTGSDAATPAVDCTNEVQCAPGSNAGENNIDGIKSIPAAGNISGKTIGDQLVETGKDWKSYQESLPITGADLVNSSDGFYTNNTDFTKIFPALNPPLSSQDLVNLYAVKHNPFAYFRSVQEGDRPENSLKNAVSFEGQHGLYADLASGHVPEYSFIAPNQCNDGHGRGNAGAFCNYDPNDNGTQAGLNPALIYRADVTLERIVGAIHNSPAWKEGRSAIVVLWDEDDYSVSPTVNRVAFIVETNYGVHGLTSGQYYNHFSLLKTVEGGLGLPCLNHACDSDVKMISGFFAGSNDVESSKGQ
jgi:phosphatidylinositol-3-phosphatase